MPRQDLEKVVTAVFSAAACRIKPELAECDFRRKAQNRMAPAAWGLTTLQQFQFGDLRIELEDRHVVVETESAGGTTNLDKYWPVVPEIQKAVLLLHLFPGGSQNNLISHLKLWDFIYERIRADLACERFDAWRFVYSSGDNDSLAPALRQFERCLTLPLQELCRGMRTL